MFQYFITLLPFSFSVLYALTYATHRDKTETQRLILWHVAVNAVYLFSDAMYVIENALDYRAYLIADTLAHFVTPVLPVVGFLVLYSFRHTTSEFRRFYWLGVLATFYGTACLTVTLLAGFDNVVAFLESFYEHMSFEPQFDTPIFHTWFVLSVPCYYLLLTAEIVVVLAYVIYYLHRKRFGFGSLWRFLFNGGEATPLIVCCWSTIAFCLLCGLRMGLGRGFWMNHVNLSIVVSLCMAFIVYSFYSIGLVSHMYEGTLREMLHPLMLAPMHDADNMPLSSLPEDNVIPDEERLTDELIDIMENKLLFRNPNITIEDLALRLNVDRMVVTQIIDRHMGCSFRDYANKLRVLHAKQYMTLHPFETQEKVAQESGFADASSFNKKFRQIEGLTPREWSTQHKRQQKQRTR